MKDLKLPPRPTFTGPDLSLLYNDLKKAYKKLEAQHDSNKNCLNCKSHYMRLGNNIECKKLHRNVKICDQWKQL